MFRATEQVLGILDAYHYFYDLLADTLIYSKNAGDKSGRIFSCWFYSTTFGTEISFLFDATNQSITNEKLREAAAKQLTLEYMNRIKW